MTEPVNPTKNSRSLEETIQDRLNASHQSSNIVRTTDNIILYNKNKEEMSGKGVVAEKGVKIINHLSCGCEFRGQPTIRTKEKPDLLYCEKCFCRCFRCKKPMMISMSHPLAGHLYCRLHYWTTLLKILIGGLGKALVRFITWIGRYG
jgi:hypothetical protein